MERSLTATIVTIGDELLCGRVVDSNAAVLGRLLAELGIEVVEQRTVGDARDRILGALREATSRDDVVLVSGGLGPTPDDRTREVLAELAGTDLVESAAVIEKLHALAARRGRPLAPGAALQAMVPRSAELLANPAGLAPGIWLEIGSAVLCALPGVPHELGAICAGALRERLMAVPGRAEVGTATLRTVGVPESDLVPIVEAASLGSAGSVSVAYLPELGGVDLRLDARGPGAARIVAEARTKLWLAIERTRGPVLYGDGEDDLAAVVLDALRRRGERLAVAESCTGGLIAARLTDCPGSSDAFDGGWVAYSNEAKVTELGIDAKLIARHGAVSEEVALAMAWSVRELRGVDLGLAVTGIAGPGGGSDGNDGNDENGNEAHEAKPVGLVYAALASGSGVRARRWQLAGARRQIRLRAVTGALDLVRRHLLDAPPRGAASGPSPSG